MPFENFTPELRIQMSREMLLKHVAIGIWIFAKNLHQSRLEGFGA